MSIIELESQFENAPEDYATTMKTKGFYRR